ncbi:FliI/YscN family ATPase [Aquabacterium sp.]|uniref:FliI/YscN family ATPase n=1 Tax=Aquabacterium sp. TaxID=1872578 RepID=UPI002BCA143B|nr:FliI/YscN family ATPase [Aquabacterium sp.]HSW06363.1 FliI/YscN family ATPase [Aquabacterium sp.]
MSMAAALRCAAREFPLQRRFGRVSKVQSLGIVSKGPQAALGELCEIELAPGRSVTAEVVALAEGEITLMPYGDAKGLTVGAEVRALGCLPTIPVGPDLLGRVIDAFAQPLDHGAAPRVDRLMPLRAAPLNPLERAPISRLLPTGVRVIDGLLPLGHGQRLGIFAGSGVGKSSLMGMLARNVRADINVVALIGERGREVRDFVEQTLDAQTRARTVLLVATSDQPAVVRARAAYAATAVAEYFRDLGKHVFLMMDSVTRFAMARREIDIAAGQPPTARGYTPSVFSEIPQLCERCGSLARGGSLTAMYTVLVEGDDHNEPVADSLRATLDGQIVLSRELANEAHFPAIDALHSISRLERQLLDKPQIAAAGTLRTLMSVHHRHREMVDMGLYKAGSNADLDWALACWPRVERFLRQDLDEVSTPEATRQALAEVIAKEPM